MLTVIDILAQATTLPTHSTSYAYEQGFDCGKNGANTKNCNFTIFNSPENTREWERGKKAGEQEKLGLMK